MSLMKKLTVVLYIFISTTCLAQKKHSFALGADYVKYSYPKKWNSNAIEKKDVFGGQSKVLVHSGLWLAYYYKKEFSLRIHTSGFDQYARYYIPNNAPPYFLYSRRAGFLDLVIGYNLIPIIFKKKKTISIRYRMLDVCRCELFTRI